MTSVTAFVSSSPLPLVGLALVVLASGTRSQSSQEALNYFLEAQRAREDLLRDSTSVTFTEWYPSFVRVCQVKFRGSSERYSIRKSDYDTSLHRKRSLDYALELVGQVDSEMIITDGTRTLFLAPNLYVANLWDGTLAAKFEPGAVRSGGLHCGFLFGERWISRYLTDRCALEEVEAIPGGTRLEFQRKGSGGRISVEIDALQRIYRVHSENSSGEPVVEFVVNDHAVFRNRDLPAGGMLRYHLAKSVSEVHVSLDYAPCNRESLSLLDLPIEVANCDGAMRIIDEVSGAEFFVGSEKVVSEVEGRLATKKSKATAHKSPKGSGYAYIIAALAVVVGVLFVWPLLRRAYRG